MAKINVQQTDVTILQINEIDYVSLTGMTNAKESESQAGDIIKNWLRNRYSLEFLGTWEQINNPNFKVVEFDHFKPIEFDGFTHLHDFYKDEFATINIYH